MPIRLLLDEDHAFSPDDVKILIDAFEDTLRALGLTDTEDPSRIKIAKIIIGLAKDGERDPARLRDLTLKFIRRVKRHSPRWRPMIVEPPCRVRSLSH